MAGEYTIAGGAEEADRLARQAQVMADASMAFLARCGLNGATACVDLGCGRGQVTIAMAQAVGPEGRVVGIDADPEAIRDAEAAAARVGAPVEFVRADAYEQVQAAPFDLSYCRLLLSHLVDPFAVVGVLRDAVHPGGVVAVEDLLTGTLRSEPARPVLDELQDVYAATVRAHGGDPTIGPRLRSILEANGLEDVSETIVVNPMRTVEEKVFLLELIRNMRTAILEAGTATPGELESIETGTSEAAHDRTTLFFQAAMYQVSGRRPTSTS